MDERGGCGDLAVVGLACRLPGAENATAFWRNLLTGVEAGVELDVGQLQAEGVPELVLADPRYVRRGFFLDEPVGFDAGYFGLSKDEAMATDPGHRLLLECVDSALADAGHQGGGEVVALYAGAAPSSYGARYAARNRRLRAKFGEFGLGSMNEPDFLASGVAYRLGLGGPTTTVAAACATALVAVHLAGQALRLGECDLAVAGAVDLGNPRRHGYVAVPGGLLSPTGRVRSFDAGADGTVFSCGAGAVALRRASDAVSDGDHIYAVIKGSAVNNDGAARFNFTTPSWEGQARVIRHALSAGGIAAGSVGYVECHAPGTAIGDFVEVQALTTVFGEDGVPAGNTCAVGSAKPNVGHAGAAAGVVGLIKAVLAVNQGVIPPVVNYRHPSPDLDLPGSPFFVNTSPARWPVTGGLRRAGVSAFGAGGINAHVVLEQPPPMPAATGSVEPVLVPVSGHNGPAAAEALARLSRALTTGQVSIADSAYTMQIGRRRGRHRIAALAADAPGSGPVAEVASGVADLRRRPRVGFVFPGGGGERVGMGRELYGAWPVFRERFDTCCRAFETGLAAAVRRLAGIEDGTDSDGTDLLRRVEVAHPALFAVEYALAGLWQSWGVEPDVVVGHSLGEYAAACVAGVLDLDQAAQAVAARSRLLATLPAGSMLAVLLDQAATTRLLGGSVCVAAVNSPAVTVVAGTTASIDEAESCCEAAGVGYRRLRLNRAFHSRSVDPILPAYREAIAGLTFRPPRCPMVSSMIGDWLHPDEPVDAEYWVLQLRHEVRFAAAVERVLGEADYVLEMGPGDILSGLVAETAAASAAAGHSGAEAVPTMLPEQEQRSALTALGRLWVAGVEPDWTRVWTGRAGRRVSLPGYPYQREPYLAEPDLDQRESPPWDPAGPVAGGGRGL